MIEVALVGLGDIGLGAHLPALRRHPDLTVAAVADPVAERAASTGLEPIDLDRILAADIPGVVLATPPWVTPDLAVRCLRAGTFVLAEKPVATSVAKAAAYDVLTDDERARLQIGLSYRHDPAIQQLGRWIADGRLGGPLLVRAHIYDEARDGDPEHEERILGALEHGTPVLHEGAHVFDWLRFLLGAGPDAIDDAWTVRTEPGLPAPNLTGARLGYPGGHVALVEYGWLAAALPRCEITVLGSEGLATLDGVSFRLTLTTRTGTETAEYDGDRVPRCFDLQVARFADLIRGRGPAEPSLADGLAALSTAEAVATMAKERPA
jgi:myo-inositol 2-dehydrogenase / D-chiro-inositol 1-dehydrogenase